MNFIIAVVAGAVGFYLAVLRRTLDDIKGTAQRLSELSGKRWHDLRNLVLAALILAAFAYVALHI